MTYISGTDITYDNLHRVKTYTGLSGSFTYDAVGNITHSIEGGGSDYVYGTRRGQAVKGAFSKTYLYDSCGNMIVRGPQALAYDSENRLARCSQPGTVILEYGYALDGSAQQFSLTLPQKIEQRFHGDHPRYRGFLVRPPQHPVMDERLAQFDDVKIAVFQLPELPWLQRMRTGFLDLHTMDKDTRARNLLQRKELHFCNRRWHAPATASGTPRFEVQKNQGRRAATPV